MKINNLFTKIFIFVFFIYYTSPTQCLANGVNYKSYIVNTVAGGTSEGNGNDNSDSEDSTLSKAMEIIKFIPGISLIVPSLTCMIKAGINVNNFNATDALDPGGFMAKLATGFTVIKSALRVDSGDAAGALALQEVFSSNLYCKYQKIYAEEDKYISKSKADNSEGGYPIFPIYPIAIPIKNGQCKVGDILDGNFKKMTGLNSIDTKCSFSFSATDDQCLKDISIPIITEYKAQEIAVEVACLASSIKKAVNKAGKDVLEKEIKEQVEKEIKEQIKDNLIDMTEEQIREQVENKFKGMFKKFIKDETGDLIEDLSKNFTKEALEEFIETAEGEAKELAEKILKETIKKEALTGVKGGLEAAGTTASLFTDDRMAADPIDLMAVLMIQSTVEILVNAAMDAISGDFDCIIARLVAAQAVQYLAQGTIAGIADSNYGKAKDKLPIYKFCGHKWLSYDQDWDYHKTAIINGEERIHYPIRGANEGSYYREILDGVKNGIISNNVTNKQFREYIYGGMEYSSGIPEKESYAEKINGTAVSSDYDTDYCIDPRDSSLSGINYDEDISQRYYMRGNDKANFACNRFYYDEKSSCIVPEKEIDGIDSNDLELINTFNKVKYYKIKGMEKKDDETEEQKNKREKVINICTRAFDMARRCCKYRSKHLICLERINNENERKVVSYKFCFSHVISGYEVLANTVFDFIRNKDGTKYGPTCKFDKQKVDEQEFDEQEFEATKKVNTDYVCVYSYGLCPYNFKLNAGLNYKASFCDGSALEDSVFNNGYLQRSSTHINAVKCSSGFFSNEKLDEYKSTETGNGEKFAEEMFNRVKKDMAGFNSRDFEYIYKIDSTTVGSDAEKVRIGRYSYNDNNGLSVTQMYDVIPNSAITTDFYGKIKNICQYRAHCVEVEKEENISDDSSITGSLFLDSSCSGKTSNSRNVSPGHTGNIMTQFSSPVVECIFESFKNLLNGVAGVSLCKDDTVNNSEGYCGLDDENDINKHINNKDYAYFESKYQKIDGTYIIKGQKLPDSYNPFYKLQRYLLRTIKAAFALFLVVFFYKKLLLGDLESFVKPENISKLVFSAFKFSLVIWLIFYNGWQQGVYEKLVNFATASYSFVNTIFVRTMKNPKNQMINFSGENKILRIVEKNYLTEEDEPVMLCISYSIFDNVTYSRRNQDTKRCEKGFYSNYVINSSYDESSEIIVKKATKQERRTSKNVIISNNQELSQLIYYIDKYNDKNSNKLKIQIKVGGGWSDLNGSDLWNKNYDGCYFDTTEYKEDKSYLASFDTLDCKLTRYLGYSVNMAAPNILIYSAIMLVPSFFFPDTVVTKIINGIGGLIFGLMMTFIFMIFNVILKAVYVFTSSFFNLSVLILISPIVLPLMFFERTKTIFDNWLEYIADNIFKPVLNFASLVIYVNLMDIVLLKDSYFNNHSSKGRGANLVCPDGSSSFVCLINGIPGIQQIKVLANSNFFSVLLDIVIVFLFFKLSDQILTDIENIAGSIFKSLSGDKQSSSALSAAKAPIGKTVGESVGAAMATGKKLEEFRHDYINNAPGALFDKAKEARREMIKRDDSFGKTFVDRVNFKKRFGEVDGKFKTLKKALITADGTFAAITSPVSAGLSYAVRGVTRGTGLIGEGLENIRTKRNLFLNRANSLADYSKRIVLSKAKDVKNRITLKDYNNYQKVKGLLKENRSTYNNNVKEDINRINPIEEELERLRKERINNQTEDLEKRIEEKKKELEEALKDASEDYKKYRDNLKFIKDTVKERHKKKLIKMARNIIAKRIDKFDGLKKDKTKEIYIEQIVEEMDLLNELSEDISDEDKDFLKNNINIIYREDYQNQPTSFDKKKKKKVIEKVKTNLKILDKLGIDQLDDDKDLLDNLEDENP